jgi:Flp pilus assembly protein TadG
MRERRESGTVVVLVAIGLMALLGCMGLAVDFFFISNAQSEQNTLASFAGITALEEYDRLGEHTLLSERIARAIQKAEAVGVSNKIAATRGPVLDAGDLADESQGSIRFGNFDLATAEFTSSTAAAGPCTGGSLCDAVELSLFMSEENELVPFFARMFRFYSFRMRTTLVVFRDPALVAQGTFPYRVVYREH